MAITNHKRVGKAMELLREGRKPKTEQGGLFEQPVVWSCISPSQGDEYH